MSLVSRFRGSLRSRLDGNIRWIVAAWNSTIDPANQSGPTSTINVPVGLQRGDLVTLHCYYRGATQNFTLPINGGQNWIPCATHRSSTQMVQVFFCVFNGTWSASPISISVGAGTETIIGVLNAFRDDTLGQNARWALDQSPRLGSGAGTAFAVTGITPQAQRTISIAAVASSDDNTYTLTTPGRWLVLGNKQYRNTGGTDGAIAFAQLAQNTAVATGNVTFTQATLGADAGITLVLVFKSGEDFDLGKIARSRVPSKKAPGRRRQMFVSRKPAYTSETVPGDITLALTGVGSTGQIGTLVVSLQKSITGVNSTGSVGTVTVNVSKALTGVSGTGNVGNIGSSRTISLTGVFSTGAVGTVTVAAGNITLALTGVQAAVAVGTLVANFSKTLSGISSSGGTGTLVPNTQKALTGILSSGNAGTLVPNTQKALIGIPSSGNIGTLIPNLAKALNGISSTGNVGNLGKLLTIALSGIQASGAVGNVTVTGPASTVRVYWG